LARSLVTAAEFAEAEEALADEDVIGLGIKAFALQQKGLRFNPAPKPKLIAMAEETHPGVYSATIQQTTVPGTYTFYVTAEGETDDGVSFRREQQMQVRLDVRPVPEFTHFEIQYRTLIEEGQRFIVADINVR